MFQDVFGGGLVDMADADLQSFKTMSLPDFVRQHSAGFEGENLLIDTMQRNRFFYGKERPFFTELAFVPLYWIDLIALHSYMTNPDDPQGNGTDSPSWVYNLFRPNEPHMMTYMNDSGIEAYRNPIVGDFTAQEREYFDKVGYWQFISYVSPMMLGFTSLPLGDTDLRWNFSFRHFLTSFGTDINFKVLLNIDKYNVIAAYHHYRNYGHTFPAVEVQLIDFPVQIGGFKMYLSPRAMIGVQPKEQDFFTSEAAFFGLIGTRVDFEVTKHFLPYFEVTAKTGGWVAGNEFLEGKVKVIAGVSARFY
jgi:hypothetical protein